MSKNNLLRLQHFFVVNKMIKKELYDICPPFDNEAQDTDSIVKYTDKTYSSLNYIHCELNCVCADFINDQEVLRAIDVFGKKIIDEFIRCGADLELLRNFYKKYISNMKIEFENLIKSECIGYTGNEFPKNSFNQASSINEMLHLIHSYIMNNEEFYQAVPKSNEKKNNFDYPITLYGEANDFSNDVFSKFPIAIDCGWTDIVSIGNDKVIMMVRDRGHALTIEITKTSSKYLIEYFIPKLCNISMINALPGVNKVEPGTPGATGIFETENLFDLYNLIANVPTDVDMIHESFNSSYRI